VPPLSAVATQSDQPLTLDRASNCTTNTAASSQAETSVRWRIFEAVTTTSEPARGLTAPVGRGLHCARMQSDVSDILRKLDVHSRIDIAREAALRAVPPRW